MRIALRIAAAAFALLVALAVAFVVFLPRLLSSDAAGRRLQAAARDAVGREVRWQELGVALFPPRLVVSGVDLLDPGGREEVALRAARIDLKVAWLPLLVRQVVIDSLVLEGIELGMVRTGDGLELPVAFPSDADRAAPTTPQPAEQAAPAEGIALAVREFRLVDGVLRLVDRSVSPAITWELRDLGLELEAHALDQPVEFAARGALASGGRLSAEGSLVLGGPLDVQLELREVALAPFRPYLGEVELEGLASGEATLRGSAGAPESLTATLELAGGRIRVDELRATGPVALTVSVEQLAVPQGSFQLDARRAELVYGGAFHKAAGTEAKASGRFRMAPGGDVEVDVERLKIKNANGAGSAALTDARVRVGLRLDPFELDGWQALIPASRFPSCKPPSRRFDSAAERSSTKSS